MTIEYSLFVEGKYILQCFIHLNGGGGVIIITLDSASEFYVVG